MAEEVDSTPLSASSIERRNSMESFLQHRPDPQDLREKHILIGGEVAPYTSESEPSLQRRRTSESIQKHLEMRPEREELIERNILPSYHTAPALQAQARELEKHMLADNLEHKIVSRPQPEVLIAQGILEQGEDPREPSV